MPGKFGFFRMAIAAMVLGLVFGGCENPNDGGSSGTFYAGKKEAPSPSSSMSRRAAPAGAMTAADVPLEEFSIAIDYFVGGSTKTRFNLWGVLNYDGQTHTSAAVIPVTEIIELRDLSALRPQAGNDYCDVFGFDIKLLHNGTEIANFPESYFIKDEELAFYDNPKNPSVLSDPWNNAQAMFDKYPAPGFSDNMSDDFVVVPFDGIDLNRQFDLKFEWDISIIVQALADAYDEGDYTNVGDRTKEHFQTFFKSLALKVTYL